MTSVVDPSGIERFSRVPAGRNGRELDELSARSTVSNTPTWTSCLIVVPCSGAEADRETHHRCGSSVLPSTRCPVPLPRS